MAPQDSFIEEEEDTCPLCIEEFDLSDRNFRPCPCGYQVCQFCFNNIKNNMNGLCPACRRPYDEKTIQWKVVTQEEVAEFRANIQKNQKKRAQEQRQKEVQKREAEKENRKNLIGVRVVQKNLVYITGLAPTVREDELLKTLRKPEFFGQYGNIQKISISNRKSSDGQHQSLGIYVTFERPEEATRCIQAVHGSQNGDRILKAQHGTTKYCSAWLKNEKCGNPGCMFLHEQGDEEDSYSRQDLSSMNSIHTQRPLPGGGSSRSASRQQAPQPTPPPVVSHPMTRSVSKEGSENGVDGSALPSSANWARNPQRSRRGSHATSGAASSPAVSMSLPVTAEAVPEEAVEDAQEPEAGPSTANKPKEPEPTPEPIKETKGLPESSLKALLKALQGCSLPRVVDPDSDDLGPPLFDVRGGEKRKAMREEEDSRLSGEQEEAAEAREPSEGEPETGGSLALGGEPEDRDTTGDSRGFDRRPSTQPPIQRSTTDGNPGSRSMTPQQLFLRSQSGFNDVPPGISNQGQGSTFQGQGHNRQSSRFSFANDNASSATNVKLAANPRIMAQQSSMMPNSFQSQGNNQFYGTSMPGPPPGLKSTGTPPSMFGQFGGGFGGAPKDNSTELLQSLINRRGAGNNQAHDAGKHDELPSLDEARNSVDALVADDPITDLDGRRSVPPGLALPPGLPTNISRPPSTPGSSRLHHVVPALPKVPPPGFPQGALTPEHSPRKPVTPISEAKKNLKSLAAESGLSKEITAQSQTKQIKGTALQDEDFPALDALKNKDRPSTPTPKATPKAKRQAEKIVDKLLAKAGPSLETKSQDVKPAMTTTAEKKPVSIDTRAAGGSPSKTGESSATTEKSTTELSAAFPPLPTPSAAGISSPITRTAPKTLRVVPTQRVEAPPPASPALTMASVALSATSRVISASYRPETPASEMVSDTASVISASVTHSRANSPPPNRIGSATVRTTTKSQQRKQRKDALKQETKLIAEAPKEPEEHAPVLGRKKKQKKEKPVKAPQPRPATPAQEPVKAEPTPAEPAVPEQPREKEIEEKPVKSKAAQKKAAKGKGKTKEVEPEVAPTPQLPPQEPAATEPETPEVPEKPQPGPSSVFTEIKNALWSSSIDKLHLLKPISGSSSRTDPNSANSNANKAGHCKDCSCKCGEIQDEDLAALRAGKPVRKQFHVDGSRMLITPNGDCIRGLTPEEEDAFLELQAAIAATAENPGAFIAPRHQPGSGAFSLIKGRAVPNGRPNIFPATAQPQSQDPIGKLQREDALSYINQYVLPRLNLGATNMGFPKGASPTKDAAAASLNSLAPYFYGPDAAAGVGIYTPPDGARAMQDFSSAGMSSEERGKNFGMGVSGMPLMSVEDAEGALAAARRETEKLEKGLNQVIRRNRRLLLGNGN
ncbi:transcriptional repressor general negative regulator of transcription subunit 4 [Fusarium falciforme]|nr:transcriptional repressor general negative regulator of transcription subunit 4 [Fusarium falciforme]